MLHRLQNLETGEFFVLAQNETLTFDLNSTLFNDSADFLGSYSYPFKMPLEPNRRNLKNKHYINTSATNRAINVLWYLGAMPFKQVKMFWTVNEQEIEANLYIDSAIIANELKTVKLNLMSGDGINDQVNNSTADELRTYMMNAAAAAPGTYPMTFFPFKNDGAYKTEAYTGSTPYNNLIAYGVGNIVLLTSNNHVYSCTAATTAGQDPINYGPTQTSNPVKWDDITSYPDIALPVSKIMNRWELDLTGVGGFKMNPDGGPSDQTIIPAFYLVYILKRIAHYLGYTMQGEWMFDDNANRIVVLPNLPIDGYIIPDFYLLMPGIFIGEFLKTVRNRLGLLIDFDQRRKVMTVESITNLIQGGTIVDLQKFQLTAGFRETATDTKAWIITQKADGGDAAWANTRDQDWPTLQIGDTGSAISVNQITLSDVATQMVVEQSPTDKAYIGSIIPIYTTWRIPWLSMPISADTPLNQVSEFTGDPNAFGVRLLYYHGMQPDSGAYLYPYASYDNKDPELNPRVDYTLNVGDNTGTKNPTGDYYGYQLNSKPFEMDFELTLEVINAIKSNSRLVCRDFNNSAAMALLSQMSADLNNSQNEILAKLTLWPIIKVNNTAQVTTFTPPPPPPDNGTVWVKLDFRNVIDGTHSEPPPEYTYTDEDIYAMFYEDEAMTTPKNVTSLTLRLRVTETDIVSGTTTTTISYPSFTVTSAGDEVLVESAVPTDHTSGSITIHWEYVLMPDSRYNIIS